MELQHLRYFVDIARLENMSKVAEKNHVAQSALSRVVAVLEKELETKLRAYCYQAGFVPTIIGEVSLPVGQRNLMDTTPERRIVVLTSQDVALTDLFWGENYCILPIRDPVCLIDTSMAWSASIPLRPSVEIFRDFALNYYREMDGVKAPETP